MRNARFVLVSESDAPLHHGSVVFWQLMNEKYSRLGALESWGDLIRHDQVRSQQCNNSFLYSCDSDAASRPAPPSFLRSLQQRDRL